MKYLNKSFSVAMPAHVSDEDWAAAFQETEDEPAEKETDEDSPPRP
jgi:hypothetical protein